MEYNDMIQSLIFDKLIIQPANYTSKAHIACTFNMKRIHINQVKYNFNTMFFYELHTKSVRLLNYGSIFFYFFFDKWFNLLKVEIRLLLVRIILYSIFGFNFTSHAILA
jgi:hypothetical protein